jgi:hypothetical protein
MDLKKSQTLELKELRKEEYLKTIAVFANTGRGLKKSATTTRQGSRKNGIRIANYKAVRKGEGKSGKNQNSAVNLSDMQPKQC